jgi:hypothetical protein
MANVGLGMMLDTVPPNTAHLRSLFNELVEHDPALRRRLSRARSVGKVVGWPLLTYDARRTLIGERVMLVGDAAGLINPLNGEGIQYALQSGRWAAEVATHSAQADDFSEVALGVYSRRVVRELKADMEAARLLIALIRNRSLAPLWMFGMRAIAGCARGDADFAAIVGGVLAGVVPTHHAISLKLLRKAIWHGANLVERHIADALNRGGMPVTQADMAFGRRLALSMIEVGRDPSSHAHWVRDVVSAAERVRENASPIAGDSRT